MLNKKGCKDIEEILYVMTGWEACDFVWSALVLARTFAKITYSFKKHFVLTGI